jgi:hypothetical protein
MDLEEKLGIGCISFILLAIIVGAIVYTISLKGSAEVITGTMEKTFVDDGYLYFVFLEDGEDEPEVFSNVDSLLFGKYNSADFAADLEAGNRYTMRVAGWRRPFWSMFRNIIEYELLEE